MPEKRKLALALNTLAVALVLLFIFLAVRSFLDQTEAHVEEEITCRMALIADGRANAVASAVEAIEADALLAADSLGQCGGFATPGAAAYLELLAGRGDFASVGVAYPDGSVPPGFQGADVSGEAWLEAAAGGGRGVYAGGRDGRLTAYAPICEDGRVTGVFYGRYDAADMDTGKREAFAAHGVFFFLARADGSFLYLPDGQTLFLKSGAFSPNRLFAELDSAGYPDGGSPEGVRAAIGRGESGGLRIQTKTQDAYVYYAPAGVDDWYVLLAVDHAALSERNAELGRMAGELLAKVLFALLVATLIVLFYSWASKQAALNSVNRINAMTNTIPCGVQQFELSGGMELRYVSDGFFQMSGYTEEEMKGMFSNSFLAMVHPEDRQQVEGLIRGNSDIDSPLELKYRIITKDGRIVWLLNRATLCMDETGVLYYQCVCVDITRLKQVEQSLASKAQIDQLTGLYNRETARTLIREFMGEAGRSGSHAFFMLDMDGFKKHNDTYGHVEGDRLLCRVAGILRATFRGTDVLCRLAGDEFVAFMKNAESREVISEKAQSILRQIEELNNSSDMFAPSLSASIGISVAPQDGGGFEELYKRADEALYAAKRGGKNCHMFFDSMPVFAQRIGFEDLEQ